MTFSHVYNEIQKMKIIQEMWNQREWTPTFRPLVKELSE